jgi:hypothetical protein
MPSHGFSLGTSILLPSNLIKQLVFVSVAGGVEFPSSPSEPKDGNGRSIVV